MLFAKKQKIQDVNAIEITSPKYKITFLELAGAIYDFQLLNQREEFESVVLSYQHINEYKRNGLYAGCNIGPHAGRIKNAVFSMNNKIYHLDQNDGQHNLHGGFNGLNTHKFIPEISYDKNAIIITYSGILTKGKFPSDLQLQIIYKCSIDTITITYKAKTKKATICNLTNHTYFNLSGNLREDVRHHSLKGNFQHFWETQNGILQKKKQITSNSLFDFQKGKQLQEILTSQNSQIKVNKGIDNPFKFNGQISLKHPVSKREIIFSSSYGYVIIYTQGWPNTQPIEHKTTPGVYQGIALEFQHLPNSINLGQKETILKPFQTFQREIEWKIV